MVLLAKYLLLLFMIIVVHGNIVVDVEQKVNIDGCCNGCCPCNSCEPVKYKCRHGIDGICRKECWIGEIDKGDCEATNGEDCDYQCCVEDPCWGFPEYNLETCTKTICKVDGTIIEIIEEKPCGNDTGCCLNPNNNKMDCPGTKIDVGGCVREICTNSTWVPDIEIIKDRCVKCRAWGEPHFRAFSGATFDWHVPCKHALAQEGFTQNPAFGVFMTFKEIRTSPVFSMVGPTIYKEGSIEVQLNPEYRREVKVGTQTTTITTYFDPTLVKGSSDTIWAWRTWNDCIWMYGKHRILIELCKYQITIWAPQWNGWPGGYPRLGGLCSTNDLVKTLVARNGHAYPPPNENAVDINEGNRTPRNFAECNKDFGLSWQTKDQTKSGCPEKPYPYRRKKRASADPRTVCSDVTISPYHEECLEIIQSSTLTGPVADMFNQTCTFDLCVVDKFVNSTILTKNQMFEGYKQIVMQAETQEEYTIDKPCILNVIVAGGKEFVFYTVGKTFLEARDFCEINDMTLATPDEDFEEFNDLMPSGAEFWVDVLPDLENPSNPLIWYWQTDPKMVVTEDQWKDGRFNELNQTHCASIFKNDHLLDFPCTRVSFFACEREINQTSISVPCPEENIGIKTKTMIDSRRRPN